MSRVPFAMVIELSTVCVPLTSVALTVKLYAATSGFSKVVPVIRPELDIVNPAGRAPLVILNVAFGLE